jgi:hypothetical protein
MIQAKALKNCTPSEIESMVSVVRLAGELKSKGLLADCDDMVDAICETVHLVWVASDVVSGNAESDSENN